MKHQVSFVELTKATAEVRENLQRLLDEDGIKLYIPLKKIQKYRQRDIKNNIKGYGFWILLFRDTQLPIGYAQIEPRGGDTILRYYITPAHSGEGIEFNIWWYIAKIVKNTIFIYSESELPGEFRRGINAIRGEEPAELNGKKYIAYAVYTNKPRAIEPAKSYCEAAGV